MDGCAPHARSYRGAPAALGARLSEMQTSGRTSRRFAAMGIGATVLLATTPGLPAGTPTLLVLPLEIIDTSGETPSRAKDLEDRLAALTIYLSKELDAGGLRDR